MALCIIAKQQPLGNFPDRSPRLPGEAQCESPKAALAAWMTGNDGVEATNEELVERLGKVAMVATAKA